jgi:hypothetical protein
MGITNAAVLPDPTPGQRESITRQCNTYLSLRYRSDHDFAGRWEWLVAELAMGLCTLCQQ